MTHPTDDTPNPVSDPDWSASPNDSPPPELASEVEVEVDVDPPTPAPGPAEAELVSAESPRPIVEEETPAGDPIAPARVAPVASDELVPTEAETGAEAEAEAEAAVVAVADAVEGGDEPVPTPTPAPAPAPAPARVARPPARPRKPKPAPAPAAPPPPEPVHPAATGPAVVDDDEVPTLVWYVLKVQSSREDTIRDALERRVKIQGLQRYFGRIVVPTEKITEIRNNKKRIVERKTYPGYIMVEMELNEKTWFVVRETPGVGDFVGAHGTPTKMTEAEVNQMLGQQTAVDTESAPKVRIDVERGDRVKIKDGPFENFEGTVEEVIEARGLVKVMLIIFNRPTPVDLEYWQVERI